MLPWKVWCWPMNKGVKAESGIFLLALLVNLATVIILVTGAISCYYMIIKMHSEFVGDMVLQEQLRFAVGSMINDIRYARAVEIDGDRLIIFIDEQMKKKCVYEVKGKNLVKDTQPVTGGDKASSIVITAFSCKMHNDDTVLIQVKACNQNNLHEFIVETGAVMLNSPQNLQSMKANR